jgi:hypothetical protein
LSQARWGDEGYIDIAVAATETGMGEAADKIAAKELDA